MSRASTISDKKRLRIAKWCEAHKSKVNDINKKASLQFRVTVNQVRFARERYAKGQIGFSKSETMKHKVDDLKEKLRDKSSSEIIKDLLLDLTVQIQASEMATTEKVKVVKDITSSIKQIQSADLVSQIKNPDVERIAIMLRMLNPKLTNDQIIELWKKADDIYRSES